MNQLMNEGIIENEDILPPINTSLRSSKKNILSLRKDSLTTPKTTNPITPTVKIYEKHSTNNTPSPKKSMKSPLVSTRMRPESISINSNTPSHANFSNTPSSRQNTQRPASKPRV